MINRPGSVHCRSDNGYHLGEHRLTPTKSTVYEEDVKVPSIVRGPGVAAGDVLHLTFNNDLAPTWADLAEVTPPDFVDRRSLVPFFSLSAAPRDQWRAAILIEHYSGADFIKLRYHALRSQTSDYNTTYVEYELPPAPEKRAATLKTSGRSGLSLPSLSLRLAIK